MAQGTYQESGAALTQARTTRTRKAKPRRSAMEHIKAQLPTPRKVKEGLGIMRREIPKLIKSRLRGPPKKRRRSSTVSGGVKKP